MEHSLGGGDEHIWTLGFPEWREVTGRQSIADLHKPGERCGIYVLGFANGERYVGQAVDVVRRFGDHRKNHGDITQMTFREVGATDLNAVEQACIQTLDARGLRLRNIALVSVVQGERDLDLVVTPEEQEAWLTTDRASLTDAEEHVQDDALRARYRRRFDTFMALPEAQDALFLLGVYLQQAVPFPRRTELAFWAVSCLPETGSPLGNQVLFRVNLNMQEVFTLVSGPDGLTASFHLASSPYQEQLGDTWAEQLRDMAWGVEDHTYAPAGQDQFNLVATGVENVMDLLMDWDHVDAMCLMNLCLMRKGATYYSRYHSLDLVDAAMHAVEMRQHELANWFQNREENLMSLEPVSGLFHFAGQAFPATFAPRTWLVEACIDPEDAASTDAAHELPATFESAALGGGSIMGYARFLRLDTAAHYQLRLRSLAEPDQA